MRTKLPPELGRSMAGAAWGLWNGDGDDDAAEAGSGVASTFVYKSLGYFPLDWKSRRLAIRLCRTSAFRFLMLATVIVNAVVLGSYNPLQPHSSAQLQAAEAILLTVFTLEMIIKLFAFGAFFEENGRIETSYGRSSWWDSIEFGLVLTGWLQLVTGNFGTATPFLSAVRLVRLMQPLQRIKSVPAFHWVLHGVLRSVPQLLAAVLLMFIVEIIFTVAGLFFFQGTLLQVCSVDDGNDERRCSMDARWGRQCTTTSANTSLCVLGNSNPNGNSTSFDDAGHAWIVLFQLMTLEGWSAVMDQVSDAVGTSAQVYFVLLAVVNGWLVTNFLISILAMNISLQRKLDQAEEDMELDAKAVRQKVELREQIFSTHTSVNVQADYVRFLKQNRITLVQSMEMRQMLSYERMHGQPRYVAVSRVEYERLRGKHAPMLYAKWKEAITPLLDPLERIACIRRREELSPSAALSPISHFGALASARNSRKVQHEQEQVDGGNAVLPVRSTDDDNDDDGDTVLGHLVDEYTPPFVAEEIAAIKAKEKALRGEADLIAPTKQASAVQRLDAWIQRRVINGWLDWKHQVQLEHEQQELQGELPHAYASPLRRQCYRIARSRTFNSYVMPAVIIFNAVAMSITHYNQPMWVFQFEHVADILVFVCYVLEMLIKLVGLGPLYYVTNNWCMFEGTITMLGMLQFVVGGRSGVAVLRVLRLVRLLTLVLTRSALRRLFRALARTLGVALPLSVLAVLYLLIFALLGLHLFGGAAFANQHASSPRSNFDTMGNAMLTTFLLLLGDGWNNIFYGVAAASATSSSGGGGSVWTFWYFFAALVLGNFLMLNIFLGVLIDSFLTIRAEDAEEQQRKQRILERRSTRKRSAAQLLVAASAAEVQPEQAVAALKEHLVEQHELKQKRRQRWHFSQHASFAHKSLFGLLDSNRAPRKQLGHIATSRYFHYCMIAVICASCITICFPAEQVPHAVNVVFCCLFTLEVGIKVAAFGLVHHPGSYLRDKFNVMDLVLCLALIVSELAYAVAMSQSGGGTPAANAAAQICQAFRAFHAFRLVRYLRGMRAILASLDIACFAVLELVVFILGFFFVFAVLTTLLFNGSFYACYEQDNVTRIDDAMICRPTPPQFTQCDGGNYSTTTCTNWRNPTYGGPFAQYSFDNFGESLLMLVELASLEDWDLPMYSAMDVVGLGHQPVRDASFANSVFFCALVLVFNVLFIQLFVAVVVDSFRENERELQARAYLTPRQAEWVKIKRHTIDLPLRTKIVPSRSMQPLYDLVCGAWFKRARLVAVALNSVLLLSWHFPASPEYLVFFQFGDCVFGVCFMLALGLRLVVFGREAMRRPLVWLDVVVCVCTAVGWTLAPMPGGDSPPGLFEAVQVIDSLQVLHVVYYFHATSDMLFTMSLSAPSLFNVMMLIFLVLYCYAVIGVAVFSTAAVTAATAAAADDSLLSEYVNFDSFGSAMVTLFRMSTGESWNGIMHEMANRLSGFAFPFCVTFVVLVQFLLLNLVIAVLMCDLEDETESNATSKSSKVSKRHAKEYASVWANVRYEYDRRERRKAAATEAANAVSRQQRRRIEDDEGEQEEVAVPALPLPPHPPPPRFFPLFPRMIDLMGGAGSAHDEQHEKMSLPASELPALLTRLRPPLGLKGVRFVTRSDVLRVVRELQIPVSKSGQIHFHTTLYTLLDKVILQDVISKALNYSSLVQEQQQGKRDGGGDDGAGQQELGDGAFTAQFKLAGIFQELEELLHSQVPSRSVEYERTLTQQMRRDDGFNAAHVIATKLLTKATLRYLRNKKLQQQQPQPRQPQDT